MLLSLRLTVAVVAATAFLASGQTSTATLSGVVIDESDAAVPNAVLVLIHSETLSKRRASANSQGTFTFPFVRVGAYTLAAQAEGFAPAEVKNVVLNVGDDVSLTSG